MINRSGQLIPDVTVEMLAKNFFKNSLHYGFQKLDYLRFINCLMDILINDKTKFNSYLDITVAANCPTHRHQHDQLPIDGDEVRFTTIGYQITLSELDQLIPNGAKQRAFNLAVTVNKTTDLNSEKLDHSKIATLITHHNKAISVIAYVDYDPVHQMAELVVYLDEKGEEIKTMKKEAILHHVMARLSRQGIWFSENLHQYLNRKKSDIQN